jgi:predicted AAA+ superfamily ATPase
VATPFELPIVAAIERRLVRPPSLVQVVVGPRQVGKTTAVRSVAARWRGPVHFAAADLPLPPGPEWIETQWALARRFSGRRAALLVLDEVQKVRGWSEQVKALWDQDRAAGRSIRVVLLGSSALLLAMGVTESLAGRFFLHRCPHWSYRECRQAFGWDLDRWLFFGGYPGAAPLIDDEEAWRSYVADSLIDTVLSRDVLAMQTVAKPALLRHLFGLAASFPAQILSYNKMLGQLQDAGNTTTLAHYLRLLETAFLASGLERFSSGRARSRGSSPKLVLWNDALVTAVGLRSFDDARSDPSHWGRLVENAVGAHLLNHLQGLAYEVTYWRERNDEVDYVVRGGSTVWAIEVKSGRPVRPAGLGAFRRLHPHVVPVVIGTGGLPFEEFFGADPRDLLPQLARGT